MNVIVDYGMGNLRSVQKAFESIGSKAVITSDTESIRRAETLVVPGVGAFDRAVRNLRESGLWDVIENHLEEGNPFLGICLGFQLLFEGSEEGKREGFGFFGGTCRKFRDVQPVPHMGWNDVEWKGPGKSCEPERSELSCYYFVHSFYPEPIDENIVAGTTKYGKEFCSAVRMDNLFGVQFHPEKSQFAGLDLLEHFLGSVS